MSPLQARTERQEYIIVLTLTIFILSRWQHIGPLLSLPLPLSRMVKEVSPFSGLWKIFSTQHYLSYNYNSHFFKQNGPFRIYQHLGKNLTPHVLGRALGAYVTSVKPSTLVGMFHCLPMKLQVSLGQENGKAFKGV